MNWGVLRQAKEFVIIEKMCGELRNYDKKHTYELEN